MKIEVSEILAAAILIGIPIAILGGIIIGAVWLFSGINAYLSTYLHLSGILLAAVALICTLILGCILAYVLFWVVIIIVIALLFLIVIIAALFGDNW